MDLRQSPHRVLYVRFESINSYSSCDLNVIEKALHTMRFTYALVQITADNSAVHTFIVPSQPYAAYTEQIFKQLVGTHNSSVMSDNDSNQSPITLSAYRWIETLKPDEQYLKFLVLLAKEPVFICMFLNERRFVYEELKQISMVEYCRGRITSHEISAFLSEWREGPRIKVEHGHDAPKSPTASSRIASAACAFASVISTSASAVASSAATSASAVASSAASAAHQVARAVTPPRKRRFMEGLQKLMTEYEEPGGALEEYKAKAEQELRECMDRAQKELSDYKSQAEKDLADHKSQADKEIHRLMEQIAGLNKEGEKKHQYVLKLTHDYKVLQELFDKQKKKTDELDKEGRSANEDNQALQQANKKLSADVARLRGDVDRAISQRTAVDKRYNDLLRDFEKQKSELDSLRAQNKDWASRGDDHSELQRRCNSLAADNMSKNTRLTNLGKQKLELQARIEGLEKTIADYESKLEEQCALNKKLQEELGVHKIKESDLVAKNLAVNNHNTELVQSLNRTKAQLKPTADNLSVMDKERCRLGGELKACEKERCRLADELKICERERGRLSSDLKKATDHIEELRAELQRSDDKISELTRENKDIKGLLANAEKHVADIKGEHSQCFTALGKIESEVCQLRDRNKYLESTNLFLINAGSRAYQSQIAFQAPGMLQPPNYPAPPPPHLSQQPPPPHLLQPPQPPLLIQGPSGPPSDPRLHNRPQPRHLPPPPGVHYPR